MPTQDPLRISNPFGEIAQTTTIGSSPFAVGGGLLPTPTSVGQNSNLIGSSNPFSLQDLEGTDIGRRTIFEQARPDFLRTGQQRNVFSGMFNRVLNDFLGELGTDFSVGRPPQQSFTDFVNNQDFERQTRREGTGRGTSDLVSGARFLFDR